MALVSGQLIGEHLRAQDIAGVLLLSGGLVALALPLKNVVPSPGGRHGLATIFAVLTGFTIAGYILPTAWVCVQPVQISPIACPISPGSASARDRGCWCWQSLLRPQTVWMHLRRNWWRGVTGGVIANTGYGIAINALVAGADGPYRGTARDVRCCSGR